MTDLTDLQGELRALDEQEDHIRQRRTTLIRALVKAAGGVTEAAELLELDPRTVAQIHHRDEIAMVVYRGPGPRFDPTDGRVYGETGEGEASRTQRWADSHWWPIAESAMPKIRLLVVVVEGEVSRIWPVAPVAPSDWERDKEGRKVALPLGERPLTPEEVSDHYPALGIAVGDGRPRRQGRMREYVPVDGVADGSR